MKDFNIDYLYAGMIFGGLPQLKLYQSDSMEYLIRLSDLNRACEKIQMARIDGDQLAAYMSVEALQADIKEAKQLYADAMKNHRDDLIRIRLTQ